MRLRALLLSVVVSTILSAAALAAPTDRITSEIDISRMVGLTGNLHGFAKPEFDVGRVEGSRPMTGVTLVFRLAPAQQKVLGLLLTQLQDPNSPNYHKFLTPAQFAARFGMSLNDISRVQAWLRAEGFTNIAVANSHNAISFDGTVAQVERVLNTEIHGYLIDGVVHLANATEPSVPLALLGAVGYIDHLNSFSPKPRAVQSHLTSYVSGNHFLTPDDFATIYDINPLYTAGSDGAGQKIAIVGQSTVSTSDLNNFRSNSGLSASTPALTLIEGTGARCSGDEFESDLDIEWAGGVAKNASITFLYAGLGSGDTCSARIDSVWDALDYAVQHDVAPFISTSYGFCEQGLQQQGPPGFIQTVQSWAQQGQAQGQTIVSASGDAGAADCDSTAENSATGGLAVDVPASIPEVTGAGGNEFTGDSSQCPPTGCTTNTAPADPPYWAASGGGSDAISTALEYIPEMAWNDTKNPLNQNSLLSSSGGGASIIFSKPSWQTGQGVPNDGKRDVPDVSITASPYHDSYLICSEDDPNTGGIQPSCVVGFRQSAGGNFTAVGGTSAAAPTFTAIMTLVNEFVGNVPPTGLAPINPTLYILAGINPSPFHDVKTGNNIVPCATGTTNCTTGSYGFSAGVGYDQVTGLGSVDAFNLAQAWAGTLVNFTTSATLLTPSSVSAGSSTLPTSTVTINPQNSAAQNATFTLSCSGLPTGASCNFNPPTVNSANSFTSQMTITTAPNMATGPVTVTVVGTASTVSESTTVNLTVTTTTQSFTLSTTTTTLQVAQGASGQVTFTVNGTNGFVTGTTTSVPVTYTCPPSSSLPSETTCVGPTSATTQTSVSFTFQTTAPSAARLQRPFDRGMRIFYAALLPGLLGIMFTVGSRKNSLRGMRMVAMIVALGFSTLWLGSCSGSNGGGGKNPGTPTGNTSITINATTGGANPITATGTFTLQVTTGAR